MSSIQLLPTAERLHELLEYDPDTGLLRWRVARPPRVKVGDVAGSPSSNGYINVQVDGKLYLSHRLIWKMQTGECPPKGTEIDHCDRDTHNNRWSNLRLATRAQNLVNRGVGRNNTSGFRGVSLYRPRNKWRARISHRGRQIVLGYYDTPEEASEAYCQAARELYGEFAEA